MPTCDGCGKDRHYDVQGTAILGEDEVMWFCFFCRKEGERQWNDESRWGEESADAR